MANKQRGYYSIKLGGKVRKLHFSMNFWANFTDNLGIPLDKIGDVFQEGISLGTIRSLVYSAILANDQEEDLEKMVAAMMESRILGNDLNMGVKRNVVQSTEKKTEQ
jgi:hypothetical protein